jgi:regulator of nucleoside diphosphate kinase
MAHRSAPRAGARISGRCAFQFRPGRPLGRIDTREDIVTDRTIYVTEVDMKRLRAVLDGLKAGGRRDRDHLARLEQELDAAEVVSSQTIPSDVVTMNCRVRVTDLTTGRERVITIAFPSDANADEGKVSIVAPVATALLGYRVGDVVTWTVPGGERSLRIDEILYQPEAAGDYHL